MYANNRNLPINQNFVPERVNPANNNQALQFQPVNKAYNQQQEIIPGLTQQHQQQQQANFQQVEQGNPIRIVDQQNNANSILIAPPPPPPPSISQTPISTSEELTKKNQDDDVSMDSTNGEPKWKRKKAPGIKVNRKLKRLRMDQRLKKTLMPKNAIMVLNEMKSGVQFVFPETSTQNSLFLVHAQLDGKTYVGQGLSKPLARQNAAENALKCLVLEKMETAAKLRDENDKIKAPLTDHTSLQSLQTSMSSSINQDDNISSMSSMMDCTNGIDEKDDIPWRALANFALYKLLNEWQNQGTVVLMPKNGVLPQQPPKVEVQKQPAVKELPENPDKIHPVMLLNQMRPGITYKELPRTGSSPNILFTLSIDTDGQTFTGTAKNKKEAKKNVAINALKTLYNVVYSDDDKNKNDSMDITIEKQNNGVLDGFVPQKQESTNPVN